MRTKSKYTGLLLAIVMVIASAFPAFACTSVPVSKGASADGSVMTAHTCDGWYDARTYVVPGKTHKPEDTFKCYRDHLHADYAEPELIGEIPEAPVTYTYFHAGYPYMNEHQVIMGETTIGNRSELSTDIGLLYIDTLQILGLQRAKTAREAVQIMGELAETYGYIDGGECLTVGDPNEIWHFEVMPPGNFQKGAIWAAVRIPEGHVGVSANRSRICEVNPDDPENYMCSSNVFDVAIENGWWDPESGEEFLFWKAYCPSNWFGCKLREWRVLSMVAPSLNLDPNADRYPFTVKAERPITVQDMMNIYRDHYQGTEFDMADAPGWYLKDAEGNPVVDKQGNPVKTPYAQPNPGTARRQHIGIPVNMRNIAVPYCSYFTIVQARDWLPDPVGGLCWFGLSNPLSSVYVPIYCGVDSLPKNYAVNDRTVFTFDSMKESAWWVFEYMDNLVSRRYVDILADLNKVREPFEAEQFELQPVIEKAAVELYEKDPALAKTFLTNYTHSRCAKAVDTYYRAAEELTLKWNDNTF